MESFGKFVEKRIGFDPRLVSIFHEIFSNVNATRIKTRLQGRCFQILILIVFRELLLSLILKNAKLHFAFCSFKRNKIIRRFSSDKETDFSNKL